MCQQQQQQFVALCNNEKQKMKATYSIKKVLKTFFKKQNKQQQQQQQHRQQQAQQHQQICNHDNCSSGYTTSTTSSSYSEDLENYRNLQAEQQQYFTELEDNAANEKLAVMCEEDADDEDDELDVYVPVRFARTEAGTFFWTTNLQPVTSTIMPAVDEDLVQPAYCYSNYQYPLMQFQDRWAQA
ncbi:enhancer of split malpha protein [Musca vetustissima]|uniref:enhancer of split malpha protein n=1 Tax=Musca vetustissima TaxID=27455 RepID=UPI002AB6914D|nr:enhancer of split malpha protein [Musca vetustissima]